jgi:hypothetical protein
MKGKILFSEVQKLRQSWFWLLLILSLSIPIFIFLYAIILQVGKGVPFGNNPISDLSLIIIFVFLLVFSVSLVALFLLIRIETFITTEEINVKFFPFHRSYRNYSWENILDAVVIKYSPVKFRWGWGFGGYGLRLGMRIKLLGNNIEYCIAGNHCLQLLLKKGKKILIGTEKQYEMEQALKKIERIKKENQFNIM